MTTESAARSASRTGKSASRPESTTMPTHVIAGDAAGGALVVVDRRTRRAGAGGGADLVRLLRRLRSTVADYGDRARSGGARQVGHDAADRRDAGARRRVRDQDAAAARRLRQGEGPHEL